MTQDADSLSGVAGRYASALYELASEKGATDEVAAALANFQSLINDSPDLARLVKSPVFSAEEQVRAIGPVPLDAYRAAHRHNTWVNTERPVAFGPIELRHFVREQVFSITGHRYGNVDAAPLPNIVARARLET